MKKALFVHLASVFQKGNMQALQPSVIVSLHSILQKQDLDLVFWGDDITANNRQYLEELVGGQVLAEAVFLDDAQLQAGSLLSQLYAIEKSYVVMPSEVDVPALFSHIAATFFTPDNSWQQVAFNLINFPRCGVVQRKTSETDIFIDLKLDGSGKSSLSTGLPFFDHMLEQIARHGSMDLTIKVHGDLHIDEHHTIEDVGLALGSAFSEALGSKRGIERYGFLLPMDDCLAQVAIDFGGRPWLVWDATFTREKIGDMPTEMFYHFFKSFTDNARCNLNISASGENEHHKIEAIFKGFAKAVRMAVTKTGNNTVPSTKGIL